METPLTPTPAGEWKTNNNEPTGYDLPLPSGNVARVRRITPQAFMSNRLIPNPLVNIVREAVHEKSGMNPAALQKVMKDPDAVSSALELFDRVLVYAVIMPQVQMPPPCDFEVIPGDPDSVCGEYANTDVHKNQEHLYHEGPRKPDILYADQVDMDDKIFIFNWCLGGTRDLETFRQELATDVGLVPDGQDVPSEAKQPA